MTEKYVCGFAQKKMGCEGRVLNTVLRQAQLVGFALVETQLVSEGRVMAVVLELEECVRLGSTEQGCEG